MRKSQWFIGLVVAALLVGCNGTAPQRPSQRKGQAPEADSTQLAAMELNMHLAKTADRTVMDAAMAQEEAYALYEGKVWMHIFDPGDTEHEQIQLGQSCTLHMRIYTLEKKMLVDTEGTYMLGKSELPMSIEWNLRELHHGAKVRMFVPWYTAYGRQGTEHIPPYENLIIDLEVR